MGWGPRLCLNLFAKQARTSLGWPPDISLRKPECGSEFASFKCCGECGFSFSWRLVD